MSKLSKGYFATLKGKKVTSSKETIKVEIVERFGDVKLKTVDHSPDFEVYID